MIGKVNLRGSGVGLVILVSLLLFGNFDSNAQVVSLEVHEQRLAEIQQRLQALSNSADSSVRLLDQLREIRDSIPETEEVAVDGIRHRADNGWIRRKIDSIINDGQGETTEEAEPSDEDEIVREKLSELEYHLDRHRQVIVSKPVADASEGSKPEQEILEQVLGQPEYRPEEVRESSLKRWLRQTRDSLLGGLRRLFTSNRTVSTEEISSQLSQTQKWFLISLATIALLLSLRQVRGIIKGWLNRRSNGEVFAVREIHGLKDNLDLPSSGLIDQASRHAEAGEFREAIRFSYIASIVSLARQEMLTIEPSRTNRDYIQQLGRQVELLPLFTRQTELFEEFWYGERGASREDYDSVGSLYNSLNRTEGYSGRGRMAGLPVERG